MKPAWLKRFEKSQEEINRLHRKHEQGKLAKFDAELEMYQKAVLR